MIRALLWKEYREQRFVWLVFVLLSAVLLPFCFLWQDEERGYVCLTIVMVAAATQAVVSGAMLTAGEREEKTEAFLDLLPVRRGPLWWGKLLAGLVLSLSLCLLGMLTLLLLTPLPRWYVGMIPLVAGFGLVWGLWGGSRCRTVLGGVLTGVFVGLLIMPVVAFLVLVPFRLMEVPREWLDGVLMPLTLAFFYLVVPVVWAYRRYTVLDRWRQTAAGGEVEPSSSAWWTCLRLALQLQARPYLVFLGLSLLLVLFTPVSPLLWPSGAAVLAVLVGVLLFAEEQTGPHRFLADQRLPLGIFWSTRVSLAGGLVAFVILCQAIFLLGVAIAYRPTMDEPPYASIGLPLLSITIPLASWLLLWPTTGFAVGTLVGLLLRKVIVAWVVALGLTAVLLSVWLPSLLIGGLAWWQPLLVPLLLLVTARLLLHRWANQRGVALPVLTCTTLALLLTVAGLAYRVYSVPAVPFPQSVEAFLAELPQPTEGSQLIRRACEELARKRTTLQQATDDEGRPQLAKLYLALREGWSDDPELERWLTQDALAGDWPGLLAKARQQPVGLLLDPRFVPPDVFPPVVEEAPLAARLLLSDGLRAQQRDNDSTRMLQHLETVLVLARTCAAGHTFQGSMVAYVIERDILHAVQTWLTPLQGRADLLERLAQQLGQQQVPCDESVYRLAAYLQAREQLQSPRYAAKYPHIVELQTRERALLSVALQLPWERERLDRQLRQVVFDSPSERKIQLVPREVGPFVDLFEASWFRHGRKRQLVLAITILRVRLRLYELQQGRLPDTLQALGQPVTPDPFDPSGQATIRYRLEDNRAWLWSVGPDGEDNDGQQAFSLDDSGIGKGQDYVFEVVRQRR